ncbi:MAG: hypothetical protein QXH91_05805 [Candidatus Bathyarchaeia archaeon]
MRNFIYGCLCWFALQRDQYAYIFTPKPTSVGNLEKFIRVLQFEKALEAVNQIERPHYWLGWGAFILYLKAEALIHLGNLEEAESTLREARRFASYERRESFVSTLNGALNLIKQATVSGSLPNTPTDEGFLFRGIIFEKRKEPKQAVLEYMKAHFLGVPKDEDELTNLVRLSAQIRLVRLLREIGDNALAQAILQQLAREF